MYSKGKNMKNSVIASPSSSSHNVVITTIIAMFALLVPIFFEMDNAYGEGGANFIVNNDKTMMYSQQQ
jgi:hypothetical protein